MPTLSLHKWKLPYLSEDRASATSDLTSLLEMLLFRVSWIRAITISQVYQFAITFHLFGDMALPYILCLRCAIFYVLNALGSICRPMDFYGPNCPYYLSSLHLLTCGPHIIFFLLPFFSNLCFPPNPTEGTLSLCPSPSPSASVGVSYAQYEI